MSESQVPTTYTLQAGETLTDVAEKMGHAGEWQAIALANVDQVPDDGQSDAVKVLTVAEKAGVGDELKMPAEWIDARSEKASSSPSEVEQAADAAEAFEERHRRRS